MVLADAFADIGSAATVYSGVAGVLAGFAFTALLSYIREPSTGSSRDISAQKTVSIVLFASLAALIICAILYGEQAGETQDSPESFSNIFVKAPAFSVAILSMFYATALAARPYPHLRPMVAMARMTVGVVGPAIAMLMTSAAALDISVERCHALSPSGAGSRCLQEGQLGFGRTYTLGLLFTVALPVLSIALTMVMRRFPPPTTSTTPVLMSYLVVAVAVASTVGSTIVGSKESAFILNDAAVRAILTGTFLVLALISAIAVGTCRYTVPAEALPERALSAPRQVVPNPRPGRGGESRRDRRSKGRRGGRGARDA